MNEMFAFCGVFNRDLSSWDVSKVTDMLGMFSNCGVFNSDLSSWKVDNVLLTAAMFSKCSVFNSDLSSWDVSNVTNTVEWQCLAKLICDEMFALCGVFNRIYRVGIGCE